MTIEVAVERKADQGTGGRREPPEGPPYPDSLCHRCAARQYVMGRATLFVLCTALPVKYPPQPVLQCEAFRQKPE